uniref:UMA domain-containing protein n=1 Tax=Ascaris lumbricoides TaxID=6252 RepID=A0A0M3IU87_ASCLU
MTAITILPGNVSTSAPMQDDSFYRDPEIEKNVAKFLERHPIKDESTHLRSKHPKEINMTAITTLPENASTSAPMQVSLFFR